MIEIRSLDHLVLTVADVGATCDFCARTLGMEVGAFGKGRRASPTSQLRSARKLLGISKADQHECDRGIEPMTEAIFEGIGVKAREHEEGQVTKVIEQYTSQIPSGFYLSMAFGAIGLSLALQLKKRDRDALFVGQWVAPFMLMGLYNKLVKLQGSD